MRNKQNNIQMFLSYKCLFQKDRFGYPPLCSPPPLRIRMQSKVTYEQRHNAFCVCFLIQTRKECQTRNHGQSSSFEDPPSSSVEATLEFFPPHVLLFQAHRTRVLLIIGEYNTHPVLSKHIRAALRTILPLRERCTNHLDLTYASSFRHYSQLQQYPPTKTN